MSKEGQGEWLNTKSAAEFLGMAECSLRAKRHGRRTKRRPGPPYYDRDGGIVYRRADLEDYVESRRREPRAAKRPIPPKPAA